LQVDHVTNLWVFQIEGDDLNTQEVVHVLAARLDGEVKVDKLVKRNGDRRYEVHEHTREFTL